MLVNDGPADSGLPRARRSGPAERRFIVSADFDHDGKLDLAVASKLRIFLGDGAGRFDSGSVIELPASPGNLHTADLNGDGRPDLVAMTAT